MTPKDARRKVLDHATKSSELVETLPKRDPKMKITREDLILACSEPSGVPSIEEARRFITQVAGRSGREAYYPRAIVLTACAEDAPTSAAVESVVAAAPPEPQAAADLEAAPPESASEAPKRGRRKEPGSAAE